MADRQSQLLRERPSPDINEQTLELVTEPIPELGDGQVLVKHEFLSIDPTNRGWMNPTATYLPPVELGSIMRAITSGRVIESKSDRLPAGTAVTGMGGFTTHAVMDARSMTALPEGVGLDAALSVFGHIGLTAYFGLLDVGRPKEGDTVLVSGAAGATGSLVGQIAKKKGCRVVGTAGSDAKCEWLTGELGYDEAINYKTTEHLGRAVAKACPKGVNVFFDNVGGEILNVALANLAMRGSVVLCGAISQYNTTKVEGPSNYLNMISKRGRMEGFVILDYLPRAMEAVAEIGPWVMSGELKFKTHVLEGIEAVPDGLMRLFSGDHDGKLLVKLP